MSWVDFSGAILVLPKYVLNFGFYAVHNRALYILAAMDVSVIPR